MTWLELIRGASPEWIAGFLHKCEAFALLEGKADSVEILLKFLAEEIDDDEMPDDFE